MKPKPDKWATTEAKLDQRAIRVYPRVAALLMEWEAGENQKHWMVTALRRAIFGARRRVKP